MVEAPKVPLPGYLADALAKVKNYKIFRRARLIPLTQVYLYVVAAC